MSIASGVNGNTESDFEYWEFVHCAICFLPFVPDPANAPTAPPSVPFWLTECGHTVCNNHLNADQSCAACGAPSIQLVPLQREMMPPMSDWFRSVPHGLDALANAAKFQQEAMASLVRFYKRKCSQQRASMNKNKDAVAENKALRSKIQQLERENEQLRAGALPDQHFDQRFGHVPNRHAAVDEALSYESSHSRNSNGKRPLVEGHQHHRTSSPRSITTPLAPQRLTLPPDHQQPVLPSRMNNSSGGGRVHRPEETTNARPGSSRFDQYAYQPPEAQYRPQPLRHQQQPQVQRRQQQVQDERQPQQAQGHRQQQPRMLPPPTPSRGHGTSNASQHQTQARAPFRPSGQASQNARHPQTQMQMPPPPTPRQPLQPQPFPMSVPASSSTRLPPTASRTSTAAPSDRRFAVPPTPSNRFFSSSGGTSRAQGYSGSGAGGSTRTPFVPGMG